MARANVLSPLESFESGEAAEQRSGCGIRLPERRHSQLIAGLDRDALVACRSCGLENYQALAFNDGLAARYSDFQGNRL